MEEDPNESGVPSCRKCTYEFRKLAKAEQNLWTNILDTMHWQNVGTSNVEVFNKFTTMTSFDQKRIKSIIEENKEDKEWSTLSSEQRELLKYYFFELGYNDQEKLDALQELYIKMCTLRAWREYEVQLLRDEDHPPPPKKFPIIPPLTVKNLTDFQHYEF